MTTSRANRLFLLCVGIFAAQAVAVEVPKALPTDPRLREVAYDRNQVFKIVVRKGVATHIVLDPKEKILLAAPGFGADCDKPELLWCIVADVGSHTILVKPKAGATEPNNLELRTDKRLYSFDFVISTEADRDANSMFRVMFTYAEAAAAEAESARRAANSKAVIEQRLQAKNAPRNWTYTKQVGTGAEAIAPSVAYDDGRFTYLKFPNNRDLPEVFAVDADGAESQVNSHVDGTDTLVLHRVYPRLVLRLGTQVVGIWNDAYDPNGTAAVHGTTVDGVKRVLRGQP